MMRTRVCAGVADGTAGVTASIHRHGGAKRRIPSLLLASLLLLSACATIKPDLRADLVRAQEIAQAKGDRAGVACMEAHVKALDAKTPMPDAVGPVSAYMKARELRRSEPDEEVEFNCARLRLDALKFLYGLAAMFGFAPPLPGR